MLDDRIRAMFPSNAKFCLDWVDAKMGFGRTTATIECDVYFQEEDTMKMDNPFADLVAAMGGIAAAVKRAGAMNAIENVVFNDPATVVIWADGVKTVVRCQEGDVYDKRTGLLLCITKRAFGNGGAYNDVLSRFVGEN